MPKEVNKKVGAPPAPLVLPSAQPSKKKRENVDCGVKNSKKKRNKNNNSNKKSTPYPKFMCILITYSSTFQNITLNAALPTVRGMNMYLVQMISVNTITYLLKNMRRLI